MNQSLEFMKFITTKTAKQSIMSWSTSHSDRSIVYYATKSAPSKKRTPRALYRNYSKLSATWSNEAYAIGI